MSSDSSSEGWGEGDFLDDTKSEAGSEPDTSGPFFFPPEVLQRYTGTSYDQLCKTGITLVDCETIFRKGTEPYVVIKSIGKGSYAQVYKGVTYHSMNTPPRQEVAIKMVRTKTSAQRKAASNELSIFDELEDSPHINVLGLNEYFRNEDPELGIAAGAVGVATATVPSTLYIVSELAPFGDLYQVASKKNGQGVKIWQYLKPQYCRPLIRGIARGVRHLFSLGVSHGDVKAENVLIFWADRPAETNQLGEDHPVNQSLWYNRMVPKLTDFNNSQQCAPGGPIMCTESKCAPYTAAPESWFFVTPYDGKKADVYSVGALLLTMLLGGHPFSPPTNCLPNRKNRQTNNMKKGNLVKQLVRPFDPRLKQLLLKTLEPLPQNRITIQEFLSDDWFTQRMETQEREQRWEKTLWRGLPQKRPARRHRLKSY